MNPAQRLLLVDDDRTLAPLVREYLEAKGYICQLHHNAYDAMADLQQKTYDLCVLDVRMPMKDGFTLAAEIKRDYPTLPFLFLSGESSQEQRIRGLEQGADDYITKPFSMQELYLRVKTILRRVYLAEKMLTKATAHTLGQYRFDPASREIYREGKTQKLSAIEAKLLEMFCTAVDGLVLRDQALRMIWSDEHHFRERSLNVYVSKLRSYLREDASLSILNIHGTGYKLIVREGGIG
jgi:two-component system, OmpR family, response regulator